MNLQKFSYFTFIFLQSIFLYLFYNSYRNIKNNSNKYYIGLFLLILLVLSPLISYRIIQLLFSPQFCESFATPINTEIIISLLEERGNIKTDFSNSILFSNLDSKENNV